MVRQGKIWRVFARFVALAVVFSFGCNLLGSNHVGKVYAAEMNVTVTDAPYNAAGDGATNDRAAIQQAIDAVAEAGGGTVTLPAGKTFLSTNIVLKDNVTLHFEDGAILKQSTARKEYVNPLGDEEWFPKYGHDTIEGVEFGHAYHDNYPFVFATPGTKNIKVTGKGIIDMTFGPSCNGTLHMCPIGFYRVSDFVISDVTIQNYASYAIMPYTCNNGLIQNVTVKDFKCGCTDGISMQNCQNIRVTGCNLNTGDDSLYAWTSYQDPRGKTWWSSDDPQPTRNIEIDHNTCVAAGETKAFGFILWGASCPDLSKVEVSNIYVHDNNFSSIGIWNDDLYDGDLHMAAPLKNVRFENNIIGDGGIQAGFYNTPISGINLVDCMTEMRNGDFEHTGEAFWILSPNDNPDSAGVRNDDAGQDGTWYGFIDHLDEGDAKLYQGINMKAGQCYQFKAKVQTSGAACRFFVRDLDTQTLVASKEFDSTEWTDAQLDFMVPKTGNYHIGIERGNATEGWAKIDSAALINDPNEQSILTTQVPDRWENEAGPYEFGVRFQSKTSGYITKVKIYTNENESGIHNVSIWDYENNTRIAGPFAWDVPAGTTGWQIFTLPQAVHIDADKDYVAAVSTGSAKYAPFGSDANYLPNDYQGDLKAIEALGTFELGTMPSNFWGCNYFRDIVFVSEEQSIYTTQTPTSWDTETGPYELGTRFKAKVPGFITKAKIYTHENETGIHNVSIWDYTNKTRIAGPFAWDVPAGTTGWQSFTLPEPVYIDADKDYVVAVSTVPGNLYYPRAEGAAFSEPICNRDLISYVDSGMYSTALGSMPSQAVNIHYLRDVVFVAEESAEMNKDVLTALIASYNDLVEKDYTPESWKPFGDALTEAKALLENPDASIDEMRTAASKIRRAHSALDIIKKPYFAEFLFKNGNYAGRAEATADGVWVKEEGPEGYIPDDCWVYDVPAGEYQMTIRMRLKDDTGQSTLCNIDFWDGVDPNRLTGMFSHQVKRSELGAVDEWTELKYSFTLPFDCALLRPQLFHFTGASYELASYTLKQIVTTKLDELIASYEALVESDYTAESWATYAAKLAEAKALAASEDVTQYAVDNMITALTAAKDGLEPAEPTPPQVNKSALTALIASYADLAEADFTAESWAAYAAKLAEAKALVTNDAATQTQVDDMVTALTAAKEGLKPAEPTPPEVNKDALEALIASYADLAEADFTAESWAAYAAKLAEANALVTNDTATQTQVDDMVTALTAAKTALVEKPEPPKADMTALKALIASYAGLAGADFTAESWKAYADKLTEANALVTNENATQTQVNQMVTALTAAKNALVEKSEEPNPPTVDKNKLTAAIQTAEKLTSNAYTSESWQVFDAVCKLAKAIAGDPNVSQAVVDAQIAALEAAKASLKPAQPEPKPQPKTGWQQKGKRWYFIESSGKTVTGWKKLGKWYYFGSDGAMKTGWFEANGKWYFAESSGAMVTGWKKLGKWYYFGSDGAMKTGWFEANGKWYFAESSGAMVTGWKKLGKWYYFGTDGKLVSSTTRRINGKAYRFNANGVCLNP